MKSMSERRARRVKQLSARPLSLISNRTASYEKRRGLGDRFQDGRRRSCFGFGA